MSRAVVAAGTLAIHDAMQLVQWKYSFFVSRNSKKNLWFMNTKQVKVEVIGSDPILTPSK